MSDTTEMPVSGTRRTVPLPGPMTSRMPVCTTRTEVLLLSPSPGTVTNWSNSPKSSVVWSWIPEELVVLEPLANTSAVRFALGIGTEARSCVRFCSSCCCVELRLLVERPSMSESRSDVLMLGSL